MISHTINIKYFAKSKIHRTWKTGKTTLFRPSSKRFETRKASDLRESDGKGMMSSCSAGLVRCDRCWSSHLIDQESNWFERIWWKRHQVKLLCWPRSNHLLSFPSNGWSGNHRDHWSSHLMDQESRWFERIWWKRHQVKLLCWPRINHWLSFLSNGWSSNHRYHCWSSIWWTRKASDLITKSW